LNLGDAPTFGRDLAIPELHLLDFDAATPVSQNVKVELLRWMRPIRKFENSEQLVSQLRRDRSQALEQFRTLRF
jgi:riboflavin kinase/FMN adenylyltransferase